jgi:hypothetical protein
MAEATRLEARYVDRAKLDSLLRMVFRDSSNYSVKVYAATDLGIKITDVSQSQGDMIEVTAPRRLTEVSQLTPVSQAQRFIGHVENRQKSSLLQ